MNLNPEKPTTQTLEGVRELLVYLKRPVDPLPVFIELAGNVRLTKSQKGDCYYTSSLSECSCKARTFNPARPITLGSLHEVFALLKGARDGKWVVILDEFQEILKFSEEQERLAVIAQLRSSVQFLTATPVIFAGSSRNLMHGIFNHPQSAFFKGAKFYIG